MKWKNFLKAVVLIYTGLLAIDKGVHAFDDL